VGNTLVFLPEAVLVTTALASALLGFAWSKRPAALWGLALTGAVVSLVLTFDLMGLGLTHALGLDLWNLVADPAQGDFTAEPTNLRMRVDAFSLFFHVIFLFVAILAILASRGFLKREEPHQAEYYALMLLAVVGMMFTAAATDLIVLFLAFETSSLSTFALVAFRKKDANATEAAVKFFIIGAVSSAIILFGISILYGVVDSQGSARATDLDWLRASLTYGSYQEFEAPLVIALVFLIAGFGFKVATVPFHMWAPDVYHGSPTTVSAFLAAGSKKVGIVALFKVFLVGLIGIQVDWVLAIAVLAIATQTVGNILAIPQRSVKRMLAYSSIAQAGYILIALPVGAVALQDASNPLARDVAVAAVVGALLHVLMHAAMKGGAFLVVAGVETRGIPDDVEAYRGLSKRMPFFAFSMTILLLSLAGIPPLGGFFSKFILFSSAVSAMPFNGWYLALAVSGVLNSALSLYYYARVIWYMYILEPEAGASRIDAPRSIGAAVFVAVAVVLLASFVMFFLVAYLTQAATVFFGF